MQIRLATALLLCGSAAPAAQLAVKGGWAAYQDGKVCRAVAEPVRKTTTTARPFAALAAAPGRVPMLTFKLGRIPRDGHATLIVGGRSYALAVSGGFASTGDPAAIDALRGGQTMTVRSRAGFEIYVLRGAPTAIDAALSRCR
ncbi:MAG TPA: hypothetical protein VL405_05595 [Sphingomonas sp.]|nr:hypothetical protein [Sphingomonas sp.]